MITPRRAGALVRLGVITLLVEVAALAAVWLLAAQAMRAAETAALASWSGGLIGTLVDDYAPLVREGRLEDLRTRVGGDASRLGARLTVARLDGSVLADSVTGAARAVSIRHDPEVAMAIETGEGAAVRDGVRQREAVCVARRFERAGAAGVVRFAADAFPMSEARRLAFGAVWPPGLALLLTTGGLTALAGVRVGGSIRRMEREVGRIATGDLAARLKRPGADDLAALARAVNEALDAMQAEIDRRRMKHRKARAVVRSMPGAVIALDAEQRVLSVNRAGERLLVVKERAVRGRLIQEVVREAELHRFIQGAFETESPTSDEFDLDTEPRTTVQAASRTLRDPEGEAVGRVVVLQDITILRRLERMRRDFAANVSHELRTPITNIKGYIETLQEMQGDDPEQAARFLAIVARNVDRLSMIVEGMLDLARLEDPAAAGAPELTDTPARPLLETVCAQLREAASARGVQLVVDAAEDAQARMNARLIEQAAQNLVANAIKYGREGAPVRVEARLVAGEEGAGEELEIAVEDAGPGIEKRHQERIFERFYRADASRSRDVGGGGAGLGLAIVKHIARLHGGRVGVRSAVGQGSRFWMRIPVAGPRDAGGPVGAPGGDSEP
jgi:two-component system phosphate regulon sensor histidine kinase PhoR